MSSVSLRAVKKKYGALDVIHGVDLEIEEGEFCVFVGPSGCGKSTLLRMIAGLETVSGGDVLIDGARVNDAEPSRRGVAMVFQSYALYPHMSVEQNMGFGLRMNGYSRKDVADRVQRAARILQLEDLLERKPRQLSGGQRQRVAIGRAIVRDPKVFLFDEPLSNLDAELRVATRLEIAKLHRQLGGSTMIYVTHDQVEAMTLADKIVVLRKGIVEQVGRPMDLYERPANIFVAGFIGSPKMNLLEVEARPAQGATSLIMKDGRELIAETANGNSTDVATLGLRADHLKLGSEGAGALSGEVTVVERLGDSEFVYVRLGWGQEIVVRVETGTNVPVGSRIFLEIRHRGHFFDKNGRAVEGLQLRSAACPA
ncbi:ABC transporter ATP-binding protein [Rhizobium binxianense]